MPLIDVNNLRKKYLITKIGEITYLPINIENIKITMGNTRREEINRIGSYIFSRKFSFILYGIHINLGLTMWFDFPLNCFQELSFMESYSNL